jgi:hypothetical protein
MTKFQIMNLKKKSNFNKEPQEKNKPKSDSCHENRITL